MLNPENSLIFVSLKQIALRFRLYENRLWAIQSFPSAAVYRSLLCIQIEQIKNRYDNYKLSLWKQPPLHSRAI